MRHGFVRFSVVLHVSILEPNWSGPPGSAPIRLKPVRMNGKSRLLRKCGLLAADARLMEFSSPTGEPTSST